MGNSFKAMVDINIGGEERHLRYNLNSLCEAQERLKLDGIENMLAVFSADNFDFKAIRTLLWAGLVHENPDLQPSDVGGWDMNLNEVAEKVGEAFNLAFNHPADNNKDEVKKKNQVRKDGTG